MKNTTRFQIDLNPMEVKLVDRLAYLTGLRTKRELISNALVLMRWAVNETLEGRKIYSALPDGEQVRQLEHPAISSVAETCCEHLNITPEMILQRLRDTGASLSDILDEYERSFSNDQT